MIQVGEQAKRRISGRGHVATAQTPSLLSGRVRSEDDGKQIETRSEREQET